MNEVAVSKKMTQKFNVSLITIFFLSLVFSCNNSNKSNGNIEKCKSWNKNSENTFLFRDRQFVAPNSKKFDTLDSKEVLTRLFDNPKFDSFGAVWKPNYNERMSFPVSFDGNCHTAIDTIMYFNDTRASRCAVIVFATYELGINRLERNEISIAGGHFSGASIGVALFYQEKDSSWELYDFSKKIGELGYFGTYRTGGEDRGIICLKEIGDKWTCLSLKQGIGGNTGGFEGYETLYFIERFFMNTQKNSNNNIERSAERRLTSIFSYNYFESFQYPSEDTSGNYRKDADMILVKKSGDYYDIVMHITYNKIQYYVPYYFNEKAGKYIKR